MSVGSFFQKDARGVSCNRQVGAVLLLVGLVLVLVLAIARTCDVMRDGDKALHHAKRLRTIPLKIASSSLMASAKESGAAARRRLRRGGSPALDT